MQPSHFVISLAQQMSVHIKSLRRARGITQQGLADLIGVGQARVAAIEKNPGAVSLDQLLQIVHALGAKLQLLDLSDEHPNEVKPNTELW